MSVYVCVAGWLPDFLESETIWILFLHLKSVKLPLRALVLTAGDILSKIKKPVNNKCALCEILSRACGGDGLVGKEERGNRWDVVEGCREILEKEAGAVSSEAFERRVYVDKPMLLTQGQ